MASEIFVQQLAAAGRVAPPAERARLVLVLLDERGGKLTRQALAQRLGLNVSRVQGIVTGLRKVLNVEGYDVMEIDDASDSLALNVALMRKQLALDEF